MFDQECDVFLIGRSCGREVFDCGQVDKSLGDETRVFVMFASLKVETEKGVGNFSAVNEFSIVFTDDITDLPPERKVEFAIDLVYEIVLISMVPYQMYAWELCEL